MRIFVGNLPFNYTEEELIDKFKEYGPVKSFSIIKDKITGKSKGFGFLTIKNDNEAKKALLKLNGIKIRGKKIQVNKAKRKRISRKTNEKISILQLYHITFLIVHHFLDYYFINLSHNI